MSSISLLLLLALTMPSCRQEKETFWKPEKVTKIDKQAFRGVTSAYMDMIANMNMHLSVNNEEIHLAYPFEKRLKLTEFKSFSNCRITATGQLLDSIYDIHISSDTLKIKFYYNGTYEDDKRFELKFTKLTKEPYLAAVKQLKVAKSKVLSEISVIDLSTFELAKEPPYLAKTSQLLPLNPIQLAEELTDQKNSFQITWHTFSLSKNNSKLNYTTNGVVNTDQIGKHVAQINNKQFDDIEFVTQKHSDKTEAIMVSKSKMSSEEMLALYNFIAKNIGTVNVEQFGLPRLYAEGKPLGIHSFLAITWKTRDRVIKLAIEDVPDELWDRQIDQNVALADRYTAKDIDQVVRHYLPLIGASGIKLFIVSNELDQITACKREPTRI